MIKTNTAGPAFDGMPKDAFAVLGELERQSSFDWMRAERARVQVSLRDPFLDFLTAATRRIQQLGFELEGNERTLFRLHRDQRFHRDKRPFHGHIEAVFAKDSQRIGTRASIHVRLDLAGGFLRAGSFLQPPKALRALRESMVAREERFLDIAKTMEQRGCGLVAGRLLKRAPLGFSGVKNPALADYLRMVDPTTERRLSLDDWATGRVVDSLVEFAETSRPWLLFVREALIP
jgi:uncharacterized protein (TIGR02453 family)